jgi:hypothetical protein
MQSYREIGYRVAAMEIMAGTASFAQAADRGLFPDDQDARVEWDRGYEDCVCAYRLGHDIRAMVAAGFFAPSLMPMARVVEGLIDRTWDLRMRADPRR